MALLTPEHLKEIHDTAELFAVGHDDICPGDIASLFDHIDALTQENADLRARIAGYEQARQEPTPNPLAVSFRTSDLPEWKPNVEIDRRSLRDCDE